MQFSKSFSVFEAWVFSVRCYIFCEKNVLCVDVCKTFLNTVYTYAGLNIITKIKTQTNIFTIKQLWSLRSSALGHI